MLAGEQLVAVIDTFAGRLLPAMVHVIRDPTAGSEHDADCTVMTGVATGVVKYNGLDSGEHPFRLQAVTVHLYFEPAGSDTA